MNRCQTREDSQAGHSMLLSAVFLIVLIASCAISSSAYLGVNGNMVWRQSDSIAQILSFSGWKGLSPMDSFQGGPSWFATPLYELIVSAAAAVTGLKGAEGDLTAAVLTDLVCFWLLLLSGFRFAEKISSGSGIILIFLLATSPLYLHYYSVPIPDTLALALSVLAVSLLMDERCSAPRATAALFALSAACLIKSPIPFVLLAFFLTREAILGNLRKRWRLIAIVSLTALVSALLPEYLRNRFLGSQNAFFAQDPWWYFGSFDDRLSLKFWKTMVNRVTKAAPFRVLGSVYAIAAAVSLVWCAKKRKLSAAVPYLVSFLSGWLVFTHVYMLHDYYSLPTNFIFFTAVSVCLCRALKALPPLPDSLRGAWPYALCVTAILLTVYGKSISGIRDAGFQHASSWFLRNTDVLLYSADGTGYYDDSNVPGGLFLTPFKRVDRQDLETNCSEYLEKYSAVAVHDAKGSKCLQDAAGMASVFASDDGYTLWIRRDRKQPAGNGRKSAE